PFGGWRNCAGNDPVITQAQACWQRTLNERHDVRRDTSEYHQVTRERHTGLAGSDRGHAYGQWICLQLIGANVTNRTVEGPREAALVGRKERARAIHAPAQVASINRWTAGDQRMSLGRTTVIFQGTQDIGYRNATRRHDIGGPGCKGDDTRMAISPKQVEVVCVDDASVFYFRCNSRL